MTYEVRYRAIRDDKIRCEVVALENGAGPIVAKGVGDSKEEARKAAMASTEDPKVIGVLSGAS